jgi:hypothetical protein
MQALILKSLVNVMLTLMTPELLQKFADMVLDFAERFVVGTASTVDDTIILPLCKTIRATFKIEDND